MIPQLSSPELLILQNSRVECHKMIDTPISSQDQKYVPYDDGSVSDQNSAGFHVKTITVDVRFYQHIFSACTKIFHIVVHHEIPTKELAEIQGAIDSVKRHCLTTEAAALWDEVWKSKM